MKYVKKFKLCTLNRTLFRGWFLLIIVSLILANFSISAQENNEIWKNSLKKIRINDHFSFIYDHDNVSEITVIHILIKGGKRRVPNTLRGLAFLTTRLTGEIHHRNNLKELVQMGSTVYYHVEGDYSTISIRSLSENIDNTLKIITRYLEKPLFSGLRIENTKRFMAHRQKREEDSPELLMELTFFNTFFQSYSGSIYGEPQSLQRIKKNNVVEFYQQTFNSANIVMTVSTDLDEKKIAPLIGKYFEFIPQGKPIQFDAIAFNKNEKREVALTKDSPQIFIALGAKIPPINSKNYVMIYMLENLLGKGIGAKIWPLRAKKELAYILKTRFFQMEGAGLLTVFLKTDIKKKNEASKALKDLLKNIYEKGITEMDLLSTKERSKADFLRENENKQNRSAKLCYFEALGLGFNFLEKFFSQVDQVTLEDLNQYIKQVMNPADLVEVTICPEGEKEKPMDTSVKISS